MSKGRTFYSDKIKGATGNYNWSAAYDLTDGFVGINQLEDGKVKDRVLLSPAQMKALTEFVQRKGR